MGFGDVFPQSCGKLVESVENSCGFLHRSLEKSRVSRFPHPGIHSLCRMGKTQNPLLLLGRVLARNAHPIGVLAAGNPPSAKRIALLTFWENRGAPLFHISSQSQGADPHNLSSCANPYAARAGGGFPQLPQPLLRRLKYNILLSTYEKRLNPCNLPPTFRISWTH